MDISTEIAAIQAASQGSELRQPLVGALNKLNSGSLPAVTASDAGKILKVGANGWEAGEKSGYMPVPSASLIISSNNTYDVTNYAEALVNVPSGMGSGVLVNPAFQGLSYGYIKSDGNSFNSYNTRETYLNIFEVIANHQYALYVGETVGNRRRASFFSGKSISDFSPYLVAPAEDTLIFNNGIWLAPFEQNVDDSDNALTGRIVYTPNTNGVIVYATDNNTQIIPAYCVDMSASSTLVQKTITQNGTYDPANDDADGYSEVIANIAGSIDLFSVAYANTNGTLNQNKNSNNSINFTTPSQRRVFFRIYGSLSNSSNIVCGYTVSKSLLDSFVGKYFNLRISGTYSNNLTISGVIEADISPWAKQANVWPAKKRVIISEMPSGSFSNGFIGFVIHGASGDAIDTYLELTITDN